MIPIEDLTDVTLAIEDTDEDDEKDLTDVTLVRDDTDWKLIPFEDFSDVTLVIEEVMKVIKWWKLSSEESYEMIKVIKWTFP